MLLILPRRRFRSPHDVALIFFRRDVFDLHDRLEQDRFALLEAVLQGKDGGHLEREFVRIDFVEAAVDDVDLDIDHRIAAEHAVEHGFFDALHDRRDVFLRNRAADDLVLDHDALAALGWAHIHRRGRIDRDRRIA